MPDRQIKGQPYVAKTRENSWPATICVHLWQSGQSVVPSWASVNYAKQSQCQNGQYKHKYSKNKGVCQRTTNNEQQTLPKTNPIKPNSSPKLELCSTLSEVEGPIEPNLPPTPQNPQNSLKNEASPPKMRFFTPRRSTQSCPT